MDGFKFAEPEIHSGDGGDGYWVRCICGNIYSIAIDGDCRCTECGTLIALEASIDAVLMEVGKPPVESEKEQA